MSKGVKQGRFIDAQACIILVVTYERYKVLRTGEYVNVYEAVYREFIDAYETSDRVIHRGVVKLVIT